MININVDELKSFRENYYKEINIIEPNLDEVLEQLSSLKDSINTPNISKKIDEFNELYYEVKDSIRKSNANLDSQVKSTINSYTDLYKSIEGKVSHD